MILKCSSDTSSTTHEICSDFCCVLFCCGYIINSKITHIFQNCFHCDYGNRVSNIRICRMQVKLFLYVLVHCQCQSTYTYSLQNQRNQRKRKPWADILKKVHVVVIKWKHFSRYLPFVRGIHRSPVNSPHKGQYLGPLMLSLICA